MWIRRKKEVKEVEAASPGGSEPGTKARSSFFESFKEACKRSIDELLTRESISDDMSDHVTEEQQERELQRRFANFEPNLVARYYSDPTLCRCQDKHWAAKRGAMESQAADRWPNTNLTAAQPSCDSAVPKSGETLGSEYDPQ